MNFLISLMIDPFISMQMQDSDGTPLVPLPGVSSRYLKDPMYVY